MGHSAEGITANVLRHVTSFFLTDATLKAVNAVVVNLSPAGIQQIVGRGKHLTL
jgi:hypothetical protein